MNFENIESPQPIRGDTGGDDPGPRKLTGVYMLALTLTRSSQETNIMIESTVISLLLLERIMELQLMLNGLWVRLAFANFHPAHAYTNVPAGLSHNR